MTATERGAFCKVCQKEVIDLTNVEADQIVNQIGGVGTCVKIQQDKLDELNFFEWYNHLGLKNRLKYLFLLSLLFVNTVLVHAQTQVDYEPTVQLDSVDKQTFLEAIEEDTFYESSLSDEEEWPAIIKYKWDFAEPWIGTIDVGALYGTLGFMPIVAYDPYSHVIPLGDSVQFGLHHYSFKAQDDILTMRIDSKYDHDITLTISRDLKGPKAYPVKNSVFTIPIRVRKGEHLHEIPINSFFVGSYTIRIESKHAAAVTRIMHW